MQELHLVGVHMLCAAVDRALGLDTTAADRARPGRSAMSGPLVVVGDALLDVDLERRRAPAGARRAGAGGVLAGGAAAARGRRAAAELAARDGREVVLVTGDADDDAARRCVPAPRPGARGAAAVRGETPVKQRVRASGQSIVRLDSGERPGRITMDEAARSEVAEVLRTAGAVLVADYGARRLRAGAPARAAR